MMGQMPVWGFRSVNGQPNPGLHVIKWGLSQICCQTQPLQRDTAWVVGHLKSRLLKAIWQVCECVSSQLQRRPGTTNIGCDVHVHGGPPENSTDCPIQGPPISYNILLLLEQ